MSQIHEQQADAVIVSAFGRSNWLATELASRGWKVTLIDVSERLGTWAPADIEGPFGLFESSDLMPSQVTRLTDEGETTSVERGFALWLPEGPIEFKSDMTAFQLRSRGVSTQVEAYLRRLTIGTRGADRGGDRGAARERKAILKEPFELNWLVHFSHQFASRIFRENHVAGAFDVSRPLFAPLRVRTPSVGGFQKGLRLCHSAGVRVRARADLRDVRINGNSIDAIEVADEQSGAQRGRCFVWALTSAETRKVNQKVFDVLFPFGAIEGSWYWTRYCLTFEGRVFQDQLPAFAALLVEPCLPWTHTNLLILKAATREPTPSLDVWVRIPQHARGNLQYLNKIGDEIVGRIAAKIPQSVPRLAELPPEAKTPPTELGPVRWPVFSNSELASLKALNATNLFMDGPECWEALDGLGACRRQIEILNRLESLKAQWDEAARREALRSGGSGAGRSAQR